MSQIITENIDDVVKVAVSTYAPVAYWCGLTLEEWTFVLSAVVSVLFIIEKIPGLIQRIVKGYEWIKSKYESIK